MKKSLILLPALVLFACVIGVAKVDAQTPTQAFSDKVGYYTFDVQPNSNLIVSGLVRKKEFQGLVTYSSGDATSSTFNLVSGTLTSAALDEVLVGGQTQPAAFMKVLDTGTAEGIPLDIISNTGTSIEVAISATDAATFGLTSGDVSAVVRKHVTLKTLFESADNVSGADRIDVFDTAGGKTRGRRAGGVWYTEDFVTVLDNLPVYPAQGMIYFSDVMKALRIGGAEVSHVDDAKTQVTVYTGGVVNLVGQVNPLNGVSGTLFDTGLQNTLTGADRVDLFENVGGTFNKIGRYRVLTGTWYTDDGLFTPSNDVLVPFTSSFNVIVGSSGPILVETGL